MKIRQKLILGFVGIALLVGVVGIMCVNTSQRALQKTIGENSVAIAVETMDKIDRHIYYTIEEFQAYCRDLILQEAIAKSNREFDNLQNVQEYIDKKNNDWISAQKGTTTPLVRELLNNKLSEELREKIEYNEKKYGYKILGEVFVTNKYGANIALTDKTSDYRQDDELWWKKAREDGLYVCGVEYDESADIYSATIAIRSNDKEGNFAGVVKVVFNIEEIIDIIKKAKEVTKHNKAEFKLLDRNGKTIFDHSGEIKFFGDIYNSNFFKKLAGDSGYFHKKSEHEKERKTELLAFARSQGHQDYKGLGWILAIEYNTAELFKPVVKLRNIILSTSLVLTILAVTLGILISNYISRPLAKLEAAMDKIGKGHMGTHVDIRRNDEIGQLANAFNQMVEHRMQAEEALRISEGKLCAMLSAITDDIALIDNDLNIIWTNDMARKIFGDDIVGRKCYEVYHQRNKPCEPYPCPTLQSFQDGMVHQYETQVTDKEGKTRHLHCIANVALRDEEGKPKGVLEICRDITEIKQTEEALRTSERKYSDLVQQSPDAVISLDNIGNFLSFNPAAERVSGFSTQEVIGKHFTKVGILDKKSIPKALKEFGLTIAGAERPPFDLVIRRKDKSCVQMEANGRLIRQKGHKTWVQVTLRDITERKRAEEQLRQSQKAAEEALQTRELILETMPVGVIIVGRDKKIRRINKAALKMMGFNSPQAVIGNICHKNICPAEADKCPVIDLGNKVDNSEKVLLHSDGRQIPILKTVLPITLEGQDVLLEAFVDITELRQAEQELEKVNKDLESAVWELRRANKELQEFAYITAHDLKTPLRGIGTLANWLLTDYADKFDEQGKKQVVLLVEKVKQMSALIDGILQYSRLGHTSPEKRLVDLNIVLPDIIAGIDPPENIKITVESELPVLTCEKTQIMQVFQNLLSNAVKYMDKPEGKIKVGCLEQEDFWKFSVADNGPGIDKKYHKKIFKIFQTLCPQDGIDSTGIGLSIVKKIIELNGGIVWVESEPTKGSTFFFTLPKTGTRQKVSACSADEQA